MARLGIFPSLSHLGTEVCRFCTFRHLPAGVPGLGLLLGVAEAAPSPLLCRPRAQLGLLLPPCPLKLVLPLPSPCAQSHVSALELMGVAGESADQVQQKGVMQH